MDIRDYLRVLRRRWKSILLVMVAVVAVGAAVTFAATPQYASTARMFVTTSAGDTAEQYQGSLFSAQRVTSYADLIQSRELAEAVIEDTGFDLTPRELVGEVSAEAIPETVILDITVTNPSADDAQVLAQSYAENMVDTVRELETPPGERTAPIKATIIDAASQSSAPVSPNVRNNLGLALLVGLLLGVGLAVLRDLLDTRITSGDDLAEVTELPTLGSIPFDATTAKTPLISDLPPHAPRSETFRVLRTNLQFVDVDLPQKIFLVTSALPGEGKSTISMNVAISLAQAGVKTALVECDLRAPNLAKQFGVEGVVGLTSVLLGSVSLDSATHRVESTGLDVITCGRMPPNPAELLQSNAMSHVIDQLRERYDVVILDAPPLLPVTDAALLSKYADGTMLTVRHGSTTKDQLRHALGRLEQVDGSVVGVVFNRTPKSGGRYGAGYGYGYGYGAPAPDEAGKHAAN